MTRAGFPHSDITGSTRICRSPMLFAAYHVLHRLLMPRHSSYALISLMKFITKPWLLDKLHTPTMQISKNIVPANQDRRLTASENGGHAWIRTRDLVLIRDAL